MFHLKKQQNKRSEGNKTNFIYIYLKGGLLYFVHICSVMHKNSKIHITKKLIKEMSITGQEKIVVVSALRK